MAVRMLPSRIKGSATKLTSAPLLEQFEKEGFAILAEERPQEIVLGATGSSSGCPAVRSAGAG